jgi:L-lactate dehydrogenase complex protein LldF
VSDAPVGRAAPAAFDLATPFRERAERALKDGFLQQALTIATTKFIGLRGEAFGEFPEGEALRDRAREIKEATLQRLDHYLERLVANVEARGGHVHFAATAEEARAIVLEVGRRTGARLAVKSKSMATEEIELNEALAHAGITPVETDLGEYIIQMAGEKPSQIIAPAIHKTKGQVAELFAREPWGTVADDGERARLRARTAAADLGLTGVDLALAETGTLVLRSGPGRPRSTSLLPPYHVAVFDRGALVETLQQVGVFLEAWHARDSEFGGVTNFITGPSRTADIELTLTRGVHGPKEVHAIFVDGPLGGGEPARHG